MVFRQGHIGPVDASGKMRLFKPLYAPTSMPAGQPYPANYAARHGFEFSDDVWRIVGLRSDPTAIFGFAARRSSFGSLNRPHR
jgi:hypothetical protein